MFTALDNLVFFIHRFKKFPAYKTRDLYLTGESYAGQYIALLAKCMLQHNRKYKIFNLKGVAIGNPLMKFGNDLNARAQFLWSQRLICDQSYKKMSSARKEIKKDEWEKRLNDVKIRKEDMNKLIMNFLVTEGYVEAAEKFQLELGTDIFTDDIT
ncbi:hypothetical protein SUGI_0136490 [Cryptomeria japonica]|nr:hypothetical protein SUGI_0136490 [Cryptomeria japonica]